MKKLMCVLAYMSLVIPCLARTITVDDDGPADFNNIQAAINDANSDDTVLVSAGTYYENIRMKDGVTVKGAGANVTTIDGGENGHVVVFNLASGAISGFTITNSGHDPLYVGGVFTSQCNVTIENNIIINNNRGIILSSNSFGTITGNKVISNNDHGIVIMTNSSGIITNNIIAHSSRHGISCSGSSPLIANNTIYDNEHYGIRCNPVSAQVIVNNIITHNEYGIMALGDAGSPVPLLEISYNNAWGNSEANYWYEWGIICIPEDPCCVPDGASEPFEPQPGTGEISDDPLFADADANDFHLQSQAGRWDPNSESWVTDANTSPCIDAGNPGCPLGDEPNNANNVRINMGAYGGTAEASKTPADWRSIADLTNDWVIDFNDLGVFVSYWLDTGQCIPSDLNRNESVNFVDYAIFAQLRLDAPAAEPGIEYEISPCDMMGMDSSALGQSSQTRFTVTVEGRYIHFEDMMVANCCPEELWLEMDVTGNLITIHENEELGEYICLCICDYPVDAILGPFEVGTYTLEVYQKEGYGGFIGSTTVTIE